MTLDEACTILNNEAYTQRMGFLEYLQYFQDNIKYGDYRPESYQAYRIFIVAGREMFAKAT